MRLKQKEATVCGHRMQDVQLLGRWLPEQLRRNMLAVLSIYVILLTCV